MSVQFYSPPIQHYTLIRFRDVSAHEVVNGNHRPTCDSLHRSIFSTLNRRTLIGRLKKKF